MTGSDWEPAPHERTYYRQTSQNGQRGWLVRRAGADMIRLDRPQEELLLPFRQDGWVREETARLMTPLQVAMVALEADRKLSQIIGDHKDAKREWISMKEAERTEWAASGPAEKHPARIALFDAIQKVLYDYAG